MWNPIRALAKRCQKRKLAEGPVSNNLQLCVSQHLGDYQWLAVGAVALMVGGFGLLFAALFGLQSPQATIGLGLITAAITTFNWVYQAANRRLGVVDLFATEIVSLCKVCLVTDFAKKSIAFAQIARDGRKPTAHAVDTKEQYTPIYEKSAPDLQVLDSTVVTAVTQFYTFRSTMADCLRSATAADDVVAAVAQYDQMIYMQFLMYECARLATEQLIEFEPDKAEHHVTILCSELPLFSFLICRYRDDASANFLYRRLCLRVKDYVKDTADLVKQIHDVEKFGSEELKRSWRNAITTCIELSIRYKEFLEATKPELSPS